MVPKQLLATTALLTTFTTSTVSAVDPLDGGLPNQSLETPFNGQHVGAAFADLNGDGAIDLLFAAGRHWDDQSYALINLGPTYSEDDGKFEGVRFSEALPIGPPGAYYQIDVDDVTTNFTFTGVSDHDHDDGSTSLLAHRSTVLLVGGTCHVETPNSFGSCTKGENTPARVLEVSMRTDEGGGCSVHNPDAECRLEYEQVWEHPDPRGDRNGGFATFGDHRKTVALLGQGGIELFRQHQPIETRAFSSSVTHRSLLRVNTNTGLYSSIYHNTPPAKTDPRSDFARYAGFAAGRSPNLGGVIAAGRRSDYDAPRKDEDGHTLGINELVYEDNDDGDGNGDDNAQSFGSSALPSDISGEPYPGNENYSIQTTNYAFADINGDGVEDLLEATFLYSSQRVPGFPLPQRVHFLDEEGRVKDTLVVLEDGHMKEEANHDHDLGKEDEDAGRSVTTGQLFSDSPLPDVIFASAEGVITLFANLGVDEETGEFRGLELRHQLSLGREEGCQVRDVVVAELAREPGTGKCWVGVVCAVTCGIDVLGKNHIYYVEGGGTVWSNGGLILSE